MLERKTFSVPDYVVFGGMLFISAGIGVYNAIAGGGQRTTRQFLMADKSMNFLPVSLSVVASFLSASTLLGTPAEVYRYGIMFWITVFGSAFAPITGAFLFGPMFYNLKVVSVFEYLEMRFHSKVVRLFGAFIYIIRLIIGMGIVLYGPSIALSAVTDFPVWAIIVLVGAVCTFYTSLGGMKAVIWTDVFQTVVMLAGMLAVLIEGINRIGGIEEMWDICYDTGRLNFFDFSMDPRVRHTFWGVTIGIYFVWLFPYTIDQQMVQRFSSTKSLKDAKLSLLCTIPAQFILISLCCLAGLTLTAFYVRCDPLTTDKLNPNQLVPVFVMEILGHLHGVPGLFVACMFSGALSSVSSMLNSLAAVTWEDFLKLRFYDMSDRRATIITKVLAVIYGFVGVGAAFLFKQLAGTVLTMSLTFNGAVGSPLVGMFVLGACFTSSNWIGALIGGATGLGIPLWIGIGTYVTAPLDFRLPTSTCGCNTTCNISISASPSNISQLEGIDNFYGLSYIWPSALGVLITVVVGLIISYVTGPTSSDDVDDSLQLKFLERAFPFCFGRHRAGEDLSHAEHQYATENQGIELTQLKNNYNNGVYPNPTHMPPEYDSQTNNIKHRPTGDVYIIDSKEIKMFPSNVVN